MRAESAVLTAEPDALVEEGTHTPLSGVGSIRIERHRDASIVSRSSATSPLKLLSPRTHGPAAWIFAGTYGGGLVGGDTISLQLSAGAGTTALLSTQASTKVFRSAGLPCQQELDASIGAGATLVCLPDPLVCFAQSSYQQRQRFELQSSSNLILLDWITSGRRARGERWAFDRYASATEIIQNNRTIFRDAIRLDPDDGPLAGPQRMGACDCFATLIFTGAAMTQHATALFDFIHSQPVSDDAAILFSASPLPGGVVCRIAGRETELVGQWIHDRLSFIPPLLGQDPWQRKW